MSKSKKVYFEEQSQKIRWTQTSTDNFEYDYKFVGESSEAELYLVLELLCFIYDDHDISYNQFFDTFKELRDFCDQLKGLVDKPE